MTDVYTFPPVGTVSARVTVDRPVRRSRYALSGRAVESTAGPARRVVDLTISALSMARDASGLLERLWELTDGGIAPVLLTLPPVNWHLDRERGRAEGLHSQPIDWTAGGAPLGWTADGAPLRWFSGRARRVAASAGVVVVPDLSAYPVSTAPRFAPGQVVARAGDVLRVWALDGATSTMARVIRTATADAQGVAQIATDGPLPAGIVSLHDHATAYFKITAYNPGAQGVGTNWQHGVALREELAAEVPDPVVIDPWHG